MMSAGRSRCAKIRQQRFNALPKQNRGAIMNDNNCKTLRLLLQLTSFLSPIVYDLCVTKHVVCNFYLVRSNKIRPVIFRKIDVIVCRNVLVYFGLEAKMKVIEYFYRKLRKVYFRPLPYRDFYYPLNVFMHILNQEEGGVSYLYYGLFERSDESIVPPTPTWMPSADCNCSAGFAVPDFDL